jgi:hypothetical protein
MNSPESDLDVVARVVHVQPLRGLAEMVSPIAPFPQKAEFGLYRELAEWYGTSRGVWDNLRPFHNPSFCEPAGSSDD